jgi:hypothetical protein
VPGGPNVAKTRYDATPIRVATDVKGGRDGGLNLSNVRIFV